MASEEVYLKGKTKWFWHNKLDKYNKWSHRLYPDTDSLEKVRELQTQGVKNTIKKDEDGWYVNLTRSPTIKKKTALGETSIAMEPPKVVDKDGQPYMGFVGHGSDVTTKMYVYEHRTPAPPGSTIPGKAKAMRWDASRIDNLVPYEPTRDFTDAEKELVKGLDKQAPPKDIF